MNSDTELQKEINQLANNESFASTNTLGQSVADALTGRQSIINGLNVNKGDIESLIYKELDNKLTDEELEQYINLEQPSIIELEEQYNEYVQKDSAINNTPVDKEEFIMRERRKYDKTSSLNTLKRTYY